MLRIFPDGDDMQPSELSALTCRNSLESSFLNFNAIDGQDLELKLSYGRSPIA